MTYIVACVIIYGLVAFGVIVAVKLALHNKRQDRKRDAEIAALPSGERDVILAKIAEDSRRARERTRLRREEGRELFLHGSPNPNMVCPHCCIKGKVRTKIVVNKRGVSGGKATAALLTGGVSLLATGLSRKESGTQAWCGNCTNQWSF
jgi:hypothetical protein